MKDYPLYETTVFENFRIMSENVAAKYPDREGKLALATKISACVFIVCALICAIIA